MRIGIDIRNIGRKRTGDEAVFLNIVRELSCIDSENEYQLFLDRRSAEEQREISMRLGISGKKNFHLVLLDSARTKFDWNAWHIPRYLAAHEIDIYHTQYIAPLFVPRRTALVTHIHDVSFRAEPRFISFLDRFFLNAFIPRSLSRSDLIVVPSVFTKREVMKFYRVPEEKILVAWNAVAPEFLVERAATDGERRVRDRYRLPDSFVLSLGTLQPRKNVPRLIEAFSLLRGEDQNLRLVIAGNRLGHHVDPEIDRIVRRLNLESSIVFPGFVEQEDVRALISAARAFAFPSKYEGFGIPMLEAMSCGVPVVASDIPALRETGSDAALFANPDDPKSFADALRLAIQTGSERKRLIREGKDRAKYFSWEKSAKDILAAYEEICFHKRTASSFHLTG